MPNPGFIRGGERHRGNIAGVLGQALGQGLGEFTGQYMAEKALQEAKDNPEYKNGTLSERLNLLNQATSRYGERGAKMFKNEAAIQQQQEEEFIASIIPKLQKGENLSPDERKRLPPKLQFEYDKIEYERKKEDRELKDKKKENDANIIEYGRRNGIDDKQILDFINAGGTFAGAKEAWKPESATRDNEIVKGLQKKAVETIDKAAEYEPISQSLNEMKKLSKSFEGPNAAKGYIPFTKEWEKSAEFEALSDTVMEPVFELYNPRGTLAQSKVTLLRNRLKPNWYDDQATINSKIKALESLIDHKRQVAQKYKKLISKYNGNPPASELVNLDEEDERFIEKIENKELGIPKEVKLEGSPTREDGKVRVRSKETGKPGWVTPFEGMDQKYDRA